MEWYSRIHKLGWFTSNARMVKNDRLAVFRGKHKLASL